MHTRKIFPRGFETRAANTTSPYDELLEVSGNKEVGAIYKNWVLTRTQPDTFETVKTAIGLAHALIGHSLSEWYRINSDNEFLSTNALSFLEDTVNYLVTGKRRLSMENWHLLLNDRERRDGPAGKIKTYRELTGGDNGLALFKDSEYASAWLAKPNGITDLIQTLQLFFGDAKTHSISNRIPYNPALHKAMYGLNPTP